MTKEEVFQIMGKYYGNAHYRSAIEQNISENDLRLVAQMLDEINALGYNFSNLHRLNETEDINFVPIIFKYFDRISAVNYRQGLLSAVRFKCYERYVPALLRIYEESPDSRIKNNASQAVMSICSRKYTQEYLRIIESPDYGKEHDWFIELLCKLRIRTVLPRLLDLHQKNPHMWRYTLLRYAASFKDPSLIPYVSVYLDFEDPETRKMAKKAVEKLKKEENPL